MASGITTTLESSTAITLIKLCGLLGSDHAGERAAAALKADKLVRASGATWADVIRVPQNRTEDQPPRDWRAMRDYCAAHFYSLRERDRDFVDSLADWRGRLSEKQVAWLIGIYRRLQRGTP
jgi:hypothetical protein